jgi:ureidoglycolate lyase
MQVHRIKAEYLTPESFEPYGQVLGPDDRAPITNRSFIERGYVRIADKIPEERIADFDVLDYWAPIGEISRDILKLGYLRPRSRPLRFSWMETHLKGTQSFIPLGGKRSLLPVASLSESGAGGEVIVPRLEGIRAFLLDGYRGVNLRPSTWHWTPFPLDDYCDFIILVREKAALEDLNFVDLEVRLNAIVEIVLDDVLIKKSSDR